MARDRIQHRAWAEDGLLASNKRMGGVDVRFCRSNSATGDFTGTASHVKHIIRRICFHLLLPLLLSPLNTCQAILLAQGRRRAVSVPHLSHKRKGVSWARQLREGEKEKLLEFAFLFLPHAHVLVHTPHES